jgi:hypothetical protein
MQYFCKMVIFYMLLVELFNFEKGFKRGKISEISHIWKMYRICKHIRIDQFASRIRFRWCEFVNSYLIRIKLSCGHILFSAKTSYPSKFLDGIYWNLAKIINIIVCKLSLSCWNVSIEIGNSSLVTIQRTSLRFISISLLKRSIILWFAIYDVIAHF